MSKVYWALGCAGLVVGVVVVALTGGDEASSEVAVAIAAPVLAPGLSAEEAAARLARAGLISGTGEARLLRLGSESGWAVFQTPGMPGPGERVLLAAWREGGDRFARSLAHLSSDGGASWSDRPGAPAGAEGEGFLFDLGGHAAGATVRVALALFDEGRELWLNHAGQDYRAQVAAPVALEWLGSVELSQDGLPRAPGEPLYLSHDLEVKVQTWPSSPDTRVVALYRLGDGEEREAPLRLVATGAGEHRNNLQWAARLPTAGLERGGRVSWRLEASAGGATRREERGGEGWSAQAELESPAPTWAAAGEYWWTPGEAGFGDLPDPFVFSLAGLDAGGGPLPAIELYVPGITDHPEAERIAAGGFVRAEAYSPFLSGHPGGEWRGGPLVFTGRVGNNARYRWNLLRAHEGTSGAEGLRPLSGAEVAEGDYGFKFRVSTDGGRSWHWLGTGGFPSGGENRTLRFAAGSDWRVPALLGDPRIPPTAVGARGERRLELFNDTGAPVRLSGFFLWGPAAFSVAIDGCARLAECAPVLTPGERRGVLVGFAPVARADRLEALLGARVEGHPDPKASSGRLAVRLSASAY